MSALEESVPVAETRHLLDHARDAVATATPGLNGLHTAVEGTHKVAAALAALVATVIDAAPAALTARDGDDGHLARELVADLRATHGCLTTACLLIGPALDDLRGLARPTADDASTGGRGDLS
ncbi:hypothetical protein [Amycolatopsis anabasis]|uniref:hypothetical protein n=1 Tax=Amycolatopsis anabasis TaxID=1840409 RepID=UPI00131EA2A5|nr:hypothetical protein [Amycolatopsis anabasis]